MLTNSSIRAIMIISKEQNEDFDNKTASVRKENNMEEMNTYELETFLKMILEILKGCKSIEEAREKIKALLER